MYSLLITGTGVMPLDLFYIDPRVVEQLHFILSVLIRYLKREYTVGEL